MLGVTAEQTGLDTVLGQVTGDMLLLALWDERGMSGFAGVDLELRTGLVEVQTMGRLRTTRADTRPVTATDAALSQPLVVAFLQELAQATRGTPLEGWVDGHRVEGRVGGVRAAEMALPDVPYRLVRLTIDLATGDRQGELLLILPVARPTAEAPVTPVGTEGGFAAQLRCNVLQAEAALDAVLTRLRLPLRQAEVLEVGQLLSLPGVTVASLRLEGPDGRVVAQGRLGQSAGMRAIRIEGKPQQEMIEAAMPAATTPLSGAFLGREVGAGLGATMNAVTSIAGDSPMT